MGPRRFKHNPISFNSGKATSNRFKDESDKKDDAEEQSTIAYLQPEILPFNLMKSLLLTRGGGEDIEIEDSLQKIIQLFYKHITPKPQRIYRENRTGKLLTKLRHKMEKLKTSSKNEEYKIMESSQTTLNATLSTSTATPTTGVSASAESRLKEPITCIDSSKKKIQLNSSSSSDLDSIQIVKKARNTDKSDSPEVEKEKLQNNGDNKIQLKRSADLHESTGTKKIKLARNSTLSTEKSSQDLVSSTEKKGKNKISWP